MTIAAILREAWRNIVTGTTRAALLAILLTVVSAGLAALDITAVQEISSTAHRFVASGASVVTFTAPGRISGTACERLNALPGVRAAGALRSTSEKVVATALPSSPLPQTEVTAGVLDILRADRGAEAGIVLSRDAATSLGVHVDGVLHTRTGDLTVAGTYDYPSDGRDPGYGYAVLAPVLSDAAFDQCWADVWPQSPQIAVVMRTTLQPGDAGSGSDPPEMSQLNGSLGTTFDGAARFHARATRFAPLLALVSSAGLGFVSIRIRRLELASALHAGVRPSELGAILAVEALAWIIPAAALTAATVAVLLVTGPSIGGGAGGVLGARIGLAAVVGPFLGGLLALARTRESHLFRYFKDR